MKTRVAIIGGGIAGLTAGYLLSGRYEVTLFEQSERLGGNACTITTPDGHDVDIAVAVYGGRSYNHFFRLLNRIGIETVSPFRVQCLSGVGAAFRDLESGTSMFLTPSLRGLVAQRFRILRPDQSLVIIELIRSLRRVRKLFAEGALEGLTVKEMLRSFGLFRGDAALLYSGSLCLISSMHCSDLMNAPASFFVQKGMVYHDLLPPEALFSARFTKTRTRSYAEALSAPYRHRVMLQRAIRSVARQEARVVVKTADGQEAVFEKLIFACNADQALRLLDVPTAREQQLLGPWKYTEGRVVVHTDSTQFPKRALMEGYTFLYRRKGDCIETSVSGSLWSLPGVPRSCSLISTQHPNFPIDRNRIVFEKMFRTPLFDFDSCRTIPDLPSLNGLNNTYYCGSHFGFGLHEDAVTSAVAVAKMLGVDF